MHVDSDEEEGAEALAALGTQAVAVERGRARRECPVCKKALSGADLLVNCTLASCNRAMHEGCAHITDPNVRGSNWTYACSITCLEIVRRGRPPPPPRGGDREAGPSQRPPALAPAPGAAAASGSQAPGVVGQRGAAAGAAAAGGAAAGAAGGAREAAAADMAPRPGAAAAALPQPATPTAETNVLTTANARALAFSAQQTLGHSYMDFFVQAQLTSLRYMERMVQMPILCCDRLLQAYTGQEAGIAIAEINAALGPPPALPVPPQIPLFQVRAGAGAAGTPPAAVARAGSPPPPAEGQ
jgi:hypothetical protein